MSPWICINYLARAPGSAGPLICLDKKHQVVCLEIPQLQYVIRPILDRSIQTHRFFVRAKRLKDAHIAFQQYLSGLHGELEYDILGVKSVAPISI